MLALAACPGLAHAKSCVWKVTGPDGKVLYLGGTLHRLQSQDYPVPAAYNRAFELSQRLAFEDPPPSVGAGQSLEKRALYPKGDELKNHVDPRTYEYVLKVFGRAGTPPEKVARFRPWYLAFLVSSGKTNSGPGVESYFSGRAQIYHRSIEGLESNDAHLAVFSGLSDRQGEAFLLLRFIAVKDVGKADDSKLSAAWRNGDADYLQRYVHAEYRDYPAMADRLLGERNRAWIPKIESWIKSNQTYFVLAGAGHFGGPNGVIALLRARGYQIEQW